MTESRVGFLINAASCFSTAKNRSYDLLRSYYLMRCKNISQTVIPEKYFSSTIRCPHCLLVWNKETNIKIGSKKLSKQQRRRLRKKVINKPDCEKELLYDKKLEQVCSFCQHSTVTPLTKVEKKDRSKQVSTIKETPNPNGQQKPKFVTNRTGSNTIKVVPKVQEINVYANTKDIFSLRNNDNTLSNTIKESPKIIKNNKKKKDKFAGLCQKAVLASAKLKEVQKKQNKLNLFLKPSS